MNCSKCGTPIPEGSSFCLTCGAPAPTPAAPGASVPPYGGAPVPPYGAPAGYDAYGNPVAAPAPTGYDAYGNPVAAPAPVGYDAYGNPIYGTPVAPVATAPAGPGPFDNFLPALKGFFSPDLVKKIGAELKSNGLEWIIYGGASILMFAIGFIANIVCEFNKSTAGMFGKVFPLFPMFIALFFIGTLVYGLMSLGVFLVGNKFCKEKPSFLGALNMVGVATLPLTAIYTFNLIVGFISIWVCAILSIIALVLTAVLILAALDTNVEDGKSSFIGYAIVIASVIVMTAIFSVIIAMLMGGSIISGMTSPLTSFY